LNAFSLLPLHSFRKESCVKKKARGPLQVKTMTSESDEEFSKKIIALWNDPDFSGSFSGVANFQACLHFEKNLTVSRQKLIKILSSDPDFVLETKPSFKHYKRRKTSVFGVGILWEADIAMMPLCHGYNSYLLAIDVFSHRIFCKALKSKRAEEVQNALKEFFEEAHIIPEKIQTDQGTEFTGNKKFFKECHLCSTISCKIIYHIFIVLTICCKNNYILKITICLKCALK
jgi:hypothetical protein